MGLMKRSVCFVVFVLLLLVCDEFVFATTDEVDSGADSPPNVGNFALPGPQQPGPLISFGQNLIGRNHLQVYLGSFSPYHAITPPFNNSNASMVYGFTDTTSLFFNFPLSGDSKSRSIRTTSIEDITLQLEHAFFTAGNQQFEEQATIVGALTVPMSEATTTKYPKGFGSPTYFLGTTYNRTYVDWLFFASPGFLLTTTTNHIRLGSQGLYQAGIGHTILSVTDKSILFGLLEFDGQYTTKDQVFGKGLADTGGNVIAITPSVSFAMQEFIAQVGVGFPVVQNLNGNQKKTAYFIAALLTWTIA